MAAATAAPERTKRRKRRRARHRRAWHRRALSLPKRGGLTLLRRKSGCGG